MGLSNEQILTLCEHEFVRGRNGATDIRSEQSKALDQYYLRPNGKERKGYSTVQTSETRDAIEQMLPIVMDMYLQPESAVVFKPRAADDMQQAQQETALVNNVIFTKNNGALTFMRWFKDALLLKNGYVKVFWDDNVDDRIEKYKDLTSEEYTKIAAEMDERDEFIKIEELVDPETLEVTYNCEIRVVNGDPYTRIQNVPASRVVVAAEHNEVSLATANYCCHYEVRTKSDLITDGYSKQKVKDIPHATREDMEDIDIDYVSESQLDLAQTSGDWSRELVMVFEHYIRADKNGDGKAELLQVIAAGGVNAATVLSVEEVDFVPIISVTPFVLPHAHYGLSLADFTTQYQDTNTHILRQVMDNLNLTNNPMMYVNTNSVQNPEAVAKARLGGTVFGKTDGVPITPVSVPFTAAQSYTVLQDMSERWEKATGLNDAAVGLNAEALSQSTNLVGAMVLNQSQMRARMIASIMAETGVKELVLRVRELVMKHMDNEEIVEISGNYVPVNPRSWIRNRAAHVRIGLGTVQKAERVGTLQNIISLQKEVFAAQQGLNGPLLTHQNVYNVLKEVESLAGQQGVDRYFSNPEPFLQQQAAHPKEPQPIDTALELEAAKVAINAQKGAADVEIKREELEIKRGELDVKRAELGMKAVKSVAENNRQTA